LLVKSQSPSV